MVAIAGATIAELIIVVVAVVVVLPSWRAAAYAWCAPPTVP